MAVTHSKVSSLPDDPTVPQEVRPSDWNADHVVVLDPTDLPTITLTGDVEGSGADGDIPTTLATVNPDVGSFTNANITVNEKGLVTAASDGSSGGSLELTDGSHDLTGVTKITVSDMTVGGTSAAATLTPNLATSLAPGIVQPDGITITVAAGVISAVSGGSGTVTSVGLASPNSSIALSGTNPVTGSGTINVDVATSVVLPGAPTTTTPSVGDNSTKIPTTAFVTTAVANAISGVNPAIAVQAATTTAGNTSAYTYNNGVSGVGATLTGVANTALTVDGFTFTAVGQRILVKNDTQSPSGAFNGIYFVTQIQGALVPVILTRATDYNQPSDINNTGAIPVVNGTVNGSTTWVLTSAVATVGTDPLTYTQFSLNPTTIVTTSRTISTTSPLTGGGDLSANRTLAVTGALVNIQYITATGSNTYTPTSGTNSIIVEVQGGGAGGGFTPSPGGAGDVSNASSGEGGAWGRVKISSNFSGATVVVGTGGAGGTSGTPTGGAGVASSFKNTSGSPTTWTAGGGGSGNGGSTGQLAPTFAFGGGGGVVSGGTFDVSRNGGGGKTTIGLASGKIWTEGGGDSMYSPGGVQSNLFTANGSVAGATATGFGGGGTCGVATGSGSAANRGAGSQGIVIIYEYS